jgi:hypothetical protein
MCSKNTLGPFAYLVVIQFSRIVFQLSGKKAARRNVRDELFTLIDLEDLVNSLFCPPCVFAVLSGPCNIKCLMINVNHFLALAISFLPDSAGRLC